MTFPTIPTTGNGRLISAVQADTTATRTFPNLSGLTKNSGDLLIAVVFAYQSSATANAVWSGWTAGWTEFADFSTTTGMAIGAAYKFSTGAETGTISVTQAATITGQATMLVMSIPGAHASTPPEAGGFASGTTAAADPASFDPAGWAAEETLWVACSASGETATAGAFTGNGSAPANYTDYAETGISADVIGGVGGAVAFRQLFAASEDVGTFAVDTSNARNSALLIAVRPSATSAITLADSGAGADILQLPPTPVTLTDSGSAAESMTAGPAAAIPVHDNHVLIAVAGARTNLSFTAPTGSGTLLVVQIDKENTAAITPPTGFTQKSQVATSAPSQHTIFYGWAADTGAGPYNFTWTGSTFAGGSIHRISGAVGTGDPFDAFDHEFQNASTAGVGPAVSLTTTGDNRLLFFGGIGINGSSTWTPPSGFTEIYESINMTAARLDDPTAGATGSLTATFGTETGQMAAFLGAVLPAATEGPTDKTLNDAATQTDLVAVAAQAPLGEVGAGADLLSLAAQVALADAGAGADSLTVAQFEPKTLTDSGASADTLRVAAAVPLAEQGTGADSSSAAAQVSFADSGTGTESLGVAQFEPKTLTDAGTGADTVRVAVVAAAADSGTGADQAAVAAAVALADAGVGTDSLDSGVTAATVEIGAVRWVTAPVGTPKTLTDSGAGADTLRVTAAVPLGDTGAGADTLRPAATISLLDSGTAADSLTVGQFEPKTLADSGTAADTLRVTAAALLTDSGIAADQLQPAAAVLLADSGTAADTLQVNQGIPKTLADSGTASDQPQAAAQVPLPESGQATDTLVADQTRTLTDSATAADSLTVGQFVPKPLNDSATGADQLLAVAQTPLPDSGTAAETLLPVALVPLVDTGAAADTLVVQQLGDTKTLSDSGTGSDSLAVNQARLLADSGAGTDQLVVVQGRVLTDTATGADTLRPSALLVLADAATAGDLLALAAFAALGDHGTGQDALVVLTVARWIRTTSQERPTMTASREPATATASREPALATSSREQGGP